MRRFADAGKITIAVRVRRHDTHSYPLAHLSGLLVGTILRFVLRATVVSQGAPSMKTAILKWTKLQGNLTHQTHREN